MKRFLFPTDFSPVANQALAFCTHLAHRLGAEIIVMHAHDNQLLETDLLPFHIAKALNLGEHNDATEQAQKYVETLMRRVGKQVPFEVRILYGYPREEILNTCQQDHPDMIVMGTTGATNAVESFFGSTTSAVMLHSGCPVLAVPPGTQYRDISKIAYATDFKEPHSRIFYELSRLAKMLEAEIFCVHVETVHVSEKEQHSQFFPSLPPVEYDQMSLHVIHNHNVIEGLKEFIDQNEVGLLAMQPHERHFPQRLWKKSITRQMVLQSEVPVLSIRDKILNR
ncbi:MAG: universal stress protein [Bacteroidia bacterium]|nr:universal stress protein [Bacteroidia bacterium]